MQIKANGTYWPCYSEDHKCKIKNAALCKEDTVAPAITDEDYQPPKKVRWHSKS